MPRPADKIFLKLAVQGGYLTRQDADDVWEELLRLEGEGEPTKARVLCLEFGFMDKGLAKALKGQVRERLDQMAREESRNQRQVAGFELQEKISSGAMGTVFKARHLNLKKTVALKLLNPDFAADQSYVSRFLLEAQAAASLNHPNVVQAYDVGQQGDVHFIAMEYVEGKTIKELIQRRGTIEESAAVEIVLQVLDGLRHAWEHRLVHRDVKPANIMITREGQAKLLDLGLVRRTDALNELTGEGKAIGTPYFMAPEQALDKGADYRADIYALGATLYNMVTGEKPYVAGTPVAVMQLHIKAEIPDASERNPRVSRGLAQVIQKMLAKRPADRYQDPANLVHDLTTVLGGFMPDLTGGETPVGLDAIRRGDDEREASGGRRRLGRGGAGDPSEDSAARRARAAAGGGPPLHLLAAAAGVAILAIGAFVFLRGEPPPPPPPEPTPEVAKVDPREAEERAASALYEELPAGERWQRVDDLVALARRYPRTEAGRRARTEADSLTTVLANREEKTFQSRAAELTGVAQQGNLLDAADGFKELAQELRSEDLKGQAQRRAAELEGAVAVRRQELDQQVSQLAQPGQELEAAKVRRERALLLPKAERQAELAQVAALEEAVKQRARDAAAQAAEGEALKAARDEAALAQLPSTLVDLVKEGHIQDALDLATATSEKVETKRYQERAQIHLEALRAIRALDELALSSFAAKSGESVSLARRKGAKVTGTLAGVEEGKVKVALSSRAEVLLELDEIAEDAIWAKIRQAKGARDPGYLRGVTSLKLYRSDEDALKFLQLCQEEKLDLSPLMAELAKIGGPVADKPDKEPVKPDKEPLKPKEKTQAEKVQEALEEQRRAKELIAQRAKVFREASDVGYADTQLEPVYRFFQQGESFATEWALRRGKAFPTPPGQAERIGLRLEGREGRAEFFAPMHKDLQVRVRFIPYALNRNGRFAIVIETEDKQRISNELGMLDFRVRGRPKARMGESQLTSLRARGEATLELLREGKSFVAKVNNRETGRLELPDDIEIKGYKLSLEWGQVNLNLIEIRTLCTPEPEWVKRRLAP
ncbi:MAG: protein kinase [Planctomycetota bacterium]